MMKKAKENNLEKAIGGTSLAGPIISIGGNMLQKIWTCNQVTNRWGKRRLCSCGFHPGFKKVDR